MGNKTKLNKPHKFKPNQFKPIKLNTMLQTKIKVIHASYKNELGEAEKKEGKIFEDKINKFCKNKNILSINVNFNPSINLRHLAYIVYTI